MKRHHSDKQIRAWARRRGIEISRHGHVPKVLREGFMKWQFLEETKRRR